MKYLSIYPNGCFTGTELTMKYFSNICGSMRESTNDMKGPLFILDMKVNDKILKNTKIGGIHSQPFKLRNSKDKDEFVKNIEFCD